jgi:hypothetical protein
VEPVAVEESAAPEPKPEDPLADWPTRAQWDSLWTSIMIDGREMPAGALPGTSQPLWRVVDAEGVALFSSADVDPEVLKTRPLFWTAKPGILLGPDTLPVLGKNPLAIGAVDGALLKSDGGAEAVIYLSAEDAARLRALTSLGELVRTGSLAFILRAD